jgi:gamma-glutamyl:cysteine ligase YbdK (ATP-grasp superfamily)
VSELIRRTLERLAPYAQGLGCDRELDGIERILRDGNGAEEQLRVYAATGDPVEVARRFADVTKSG